ncbi:DUF2834 domain-containing protein [Vibrio sinensis]|uniref:DUF2834 domain-containing protein n=1 Tax=Vibrio sinensis TaxID=2302434 RepID=A0A3A6QWX2_9VIBR|nr:DUF2834 domain-containing protein [Vibrio sinensis]RJX75778.1 DUF2834 domain-containing protein [Vibrio sinensis]
MAKLYLFFALLGILLPYAALIPWLQTNGADLSLLISEALVNPISAFAWLDVFVSVFVVFIFIISDGSRYHIKHTWLALIGTLVVGVSFGLPLYLYLKEKQSSRRWLS